MHIKAGDPGAVFASVVDAVTGAKIPFVVEVDDVEGWYRAHVTGPDGRILQNDGELIVVRVDRAIRIEIPDQHRRLLAR